MADWGPTRDGHLWSWPAPRKGLTIQADACASSFRLFQTCVAETCTLDALRAADQGRETHVLEDPHLLLSLRGPPHNGPRNKSGRNPGCRQKGPTPQLGLKNLQLAGGKAIHSGRHPSWDWIGPSSGSIGGSHGCGQGSGAGVVPGSVPQCAGGLGRKSVPHAPNLAQIGLLGQFRRPARNPQHGFLRPTSEPRATRSARNFERPTPLNNCLKHVCPSSAHL